RARTAQHACVRDTTGCRAHEGWRAAPRSHHRLVGRREGESTRRLPRRAKSKDGRIVVDDHFRVNGRDDVLALGDAAYFENQGKGLPQLAQVAVLEAPTAARNLVALVRGEPTVPFVYHRKGDLIALGRTQAG